MEERIIQIDWEGPYPIEEVRKLNRPIDKGLYQIYAYHPLYGECLVYIGLTDTTFANRISSHKYEKGSDSDRRRIIYYVGRLIGLETRDCGRWCQEIRQAEMLLIHSHAPAYNSTNIQKLGSSASVANVRVLNWGESCSAKRSFWAYVVRRAESRVDSLRFARHCGLGSNCATTHGCALRVFPPHD
jgi:hypothetical protein